MAMVSVMYTVYRHMHLLVLFTDVSCMPYTVYMYIMYTYYVITIDLFSVFVLQLMYGQMDEADTLIEELCGHKVL